jgi:hypothetical protein
MNSILKILLFIIFVLILWEIEISYNFKPYLYLYPELYDDDTYSDVPLDKDEYPKKVFDDIEKGKKIAQTTTIAICGLCRNTEESLQKMKKKLVNIGEKFKDYEIIVFENDSKDNTRKLLKEWTKENVKVTLLECEQENCILKEKHGYDETNTRRLEKMAGFRERYLEYVKKKSNKFDYMLVVDMDLEGNQVLDGIFHSIGQDKEWGAIFINGRSPIPFLNISFLYDTIAHVPIDSTSLEKNDSFRNKLAIFKCNYDLYNKTDLHEVISAFNGFGLYKVSALKNCSYKGKNDICEHVNLNLCMYLNGEKIYINPLWKGYFNRQGHLVGPLSRLLKLL